MAELKLFTPEQLADRKKPKRQQQREVKERIISEYARQLTGVKPGFGGEIQLSSDDDKRKIRAILKEAATRNRIILRFRPIKAADRIEFSVIESVTSKKTKTIEKSTGPVKKKPGRPAKRT